MRKSAKLVASLAFAASSAALVAGPALAADPASCKSPSFSDIGWTDVTATTATAALILTDLGYTPKITVLSVPVTYESMKNKNIDIFLGNWMPSQDADRKPFIDGKSVDSIGTNLEGAKYTLAVPTYTYDKGLHDFKDIGKFADSLDDKIYGIEPGNDGNRHVLDMIADPAYGAGKFKLIESSEQGMLAEVERAVRSKKDIVFLGWEPHPMNTKYDMKYLTGGDALFGPNFGGATVETNVRHGYLTECPNVGKFVSNLKFNLPMEDTIMGYILNDQMDPGKAAEKWLKANPDVLKDWLAGVTTIDGKPAMDAVREHLAS